MINVNQITSQLARMPDQALQQYAMLHKNDPYTVSLALSESNRRKQMRAAGQGAQGMQEQPKVVDQMLVGMGDMQNASPEQMARLSQMLEARKQAEYKEFTGGRQAPPMPEDVGIGALPAPNMQGMAEGGIVAFGGGGDVQRFAGVGDSLVRSTTGGKDYFLDVPETIRDPSVPFYRLVPNPLASLAGKKFATRQEAAQAYDTASGTVAAPVMGPAVSAVYPDESQRGPMAGTVLSAAPAIKPLPAPSNKPPPAAGPRPAPASGNKPPVAPVVPVVPEQDYLTQLDAMEARAGDVVDPTALLKQNQTFKEVQAEKAALAERKLEQAAEFKEMFKGKEERIGKREAELGKSKDTNTGMAFLEAGLAMMQARGPGLAGIAQGAGVGLKQYQSGIKDIKAAQEKLDDARDRIEELRQNQSSLNKSEIRNAEKGIRAIVNQGDRSLIEGVEKATGVQQAKFSAAVASNMSKAKEERERVFTAGEAEKGRKFQAGESALDRQNRITVAGMPGDQQRMLTTLGGAGGLEAGLAKMQEIQADKTGAAYAKLFTETVADANKAGVTPPTAAQFAASLRQLAVALNPTKVPPAVDTSATTRP